MVEQMNPLELPRDAIEAIVRDELQFLIDFEYKNDSPDHNLIEALVKVLGQFEPIGKLYA
jgi:hypothetical protein